MGNSGSGQCEEKKPPPNISRISVKSHQKLLLDLNVAPKLRPTENGAILQEGGTISFRRKEKPPESISGLETNQLKRNFFGSEPDLRFTLKGENANDNSNCKSRISRPRKKYKAPQVPQDERPTNDFFDDWEFVQNTRPSRRLRLFKSRMDLRRKVPQPSSMNSELPANGPLIRSLSSPQFQVESIETKQENKGSGDRIYINSNKRSLMHSSQNEEQFHSNNNHNSIENYIANQNTENKFRNSRIEKAPSFHSSPSIDGDMWVINNKTTIPVKTFYFGMEVSEGSKCPFAIEAFASRIQQLSQCSSESQISSNDGFTDIIYDEVNGGISVQLRATLPRKQIDIPRFSPTAAWRMLSTFDPIQSFQEEDVIPLENRVLAPPLPVQIPTVMDKSADSGISGDASPQQHDSAAWTPQQDLEETSSDGGFPLNSFPYESSVEGKYIPRFSLSLPKDDKTARFSYSEKNETYQPYSLQSIPNLKKNASNIGKNVHNSLNLEETSLLDNNWVLSCNIPQSLNIMNTTEWNEDSLKAFQDEDGITLSKKPSFSYIATGGHIMYLPEYTTSRQNMEEIQTTVTKSWSDTNKNVEADIQISTSLEISDTSKAKPKKFTFQSTLKQNERKLLAEKLSRQAEHTELKRRSELEVMQKVEEEFQKKREREKADIRQQLRLYNISNSQGNPLESTQNQVLSELRQPLREYREFRKQR